MKVSKLLNHTPKELIDKHAKRENVSDLPTAEYVGVILDLFEAMADLFQNQCKGLTIFDSDDEYTNIFKKWCRKLNQAGITKSDMRRGMAHLEEAKRDGVRTGTEVWPPDYSSFIGHCEKQKKRKFWKSLPKPVLSNEEKQIRMKGVLNIMKE